MSTLVEQLWNDLAKLCSWKIWNSLTSCWISLFSGDFSDGLRPKEIYTWFFFFFLQNPKQILYKFWFSSFVCGLSEVLERLFEGPFDTLKICQSMTELSGNSVSISGKMALPLYHLPWWNGSFIRSEWFRKSELSQPTGSQLLIICETGERSTRVRILDLTDVKPLSVSLLSPLCLYPQPLYDTKWHIFKSCSNLIILTHLSNHVSGNRVLNLSAIHVWGQIIDYWRRGLS